MVNSAAEKKDPRVLKHLERFKSMSRITVTDFSKAFDCVDHNIAIPKLIEMGTRPTAIPWIVIFCLTDPNV